MGLMNGARLGIASQSVGAEQAAYEEALNYARDRKQFGKEIINFPAVYDMIARIKAKLDAGRSLLYMTARYVDIYKALDDISKERKLTPEERDEYKKYSKMADAFTPLAKGMNSEFANESAYDSIQVHGGSGFMLEYKCQRVYRDARIMSIYEGTTQLQTVAAIRYITSGFYDGVIKEYEAEPVAPEYESYATRIKDMTEKLQSCIAKVKEAENQDLLDLCARKLYEMTAYVIMCHLLLQDTQRAPELFCKSLVVFMNYAESEVAKHFNYVNKLDASQLEAYQQA
jgi:hypothetical protein